MEIGPFIAFPISFLLQALSSILLGIFVNKSREDSVVKATRVKLGGCQVNEILMPETPISYILRSIM